MRWLAPLAFLAAAVFTPPLHAQTCNFVEVWVDPVHGIDPPYCPPNQVCQAQPVAIGNPRTPFKTIQRAIDYSHQYLGNRYLSAPTDLQAIVRVMPGLYFTADPGVIATAGNGEKFPIIMRDRVHVMGVSARTCVLRAAPGTSPDYATSLRSVFWPVVDSEWELANGMTTTVFRPKQVLVDFTSSSRFDRDLMTGELTNPWACQPVPDTAEMLTGLTLQGSDVQVYFGFEAEKSMPLAGTVANCILDMRGGYPLDGSSSASVDQVSMGIYMAKTWVDGLSPPASPGPGLTVSVIGEGYLNQRVHIVNNTFLMAEYVRSGSTGAWMHYSAFQSAAIIDATYPLPLINGGIPGDSHKVIRGVGHPGIQNNIFRTFADAPAQPGDIHMAMVGISDSDTAMDLPEGGIARPNAFCVERAGNHSGPLADTFATLVSKPTSPFISGSVTFNCGGGATFVEDLWYSVPPIPPLQPFFPQTPVVQLWDGQSNLGNNQFDPAFVGEYMRTVAPALSTYRDWRLIPGSPMADKGVWKVNNNFVNGQTYAEHPCDALKLRTWDGEGFGNPRVNGVAIDLGFDETHLSVIAGSYANHSLSHNGAGFLNPYADTEQSTRFVFLPTSPSGAGLDLTGLTLSFVSNEKPAAVPPPYPAAWTQPPDSLPSPVPQPNSLPSYDVVYTTDANPLSVISTQTYTLSTVPFQHSWPNWQQQPGPNALAFFRVALPADNEGSTTSWVNIQPKVVRDNPFVQLFGPMQAEFR